MSKEAWWHKQFAEAIKEIARREGIFRTAENPNFNDHDIAVEHYLVLCKAYDISHLTFMDCVEIGNSLLIHSEGDRDCKKNI